MWRVEAPAGQIASLAEEARVRRWKGSDRTNETAPPTTVIQRKQATAWSETRVRVGLHLPLNPGCRQHDPWSRRRRGHSRGPSNRTRMRRSSVAAVMMRWDRTRTMVRRCAGQVPVDSTQEHPTSRNRRRPLTPKQHRTVMAAAATPRDRLQRQRSKGATKALASSHSVRTPMRWPETEPEEKTKYLQEVVPPRASSPA